MKRALYLLAFILIGALSAHGQPYSLASFQAYFNKSDVSLDSKDTQNYIKSFARHNDPTIIRALIDDVKRSGYYGEVRSNIYSLVVQEMYKENSRNRLKIMNTLNSIIKVGSKEDAAIANDFLADIEALEK